MAFSGVMLLLLAPFDDEECDDDGRENLPPADLGGTLRPPAVDAAALCCALARVLTMRVKMAISCCSVSPVFVPTAVEGKNRNCDDEESEALPPILLVVLEFIIFPFDGKEALDADCNDNNLLMLVFPETVGT